MESQNRAGKESASESYGRKKYQLSIYTKFSTRGAIGKSHTHLTIPNSSTYLGHIL